MQNLNANFPDLKIEVMTDAENDGLLLLEQSDGGNIDRVTVHPIHVRYMAEKMGLTEAHDPTAQKTIATLTRRLLVLTNCIDHLAYWLTHHSDNRVNLSYEQDYAIATADIAEEFCTELVEAKPQEATPAPCEHGANTVQAPKPLSAEQ